MVSSFDSVIYSSNLTRYAVSGHRLIQAIARTGYLAVLLGPRKRLDGCLEVVDLDGEVAEANADVPPSVGRCTSSRAPKSSPENLSMVRLALPGLHSALTTSPRSS